jgi:DNA-binding beta-propeller fold protein YncE
MRGAGLLLLGLLACKAQPAAAPVSTENARSLVDVSPHLISNETAYVVTLLGSGFTPGSVLHVGADVRVPTVFVDSRHLRAVLVGVEMLPGIHEQERVLVLRDADGKTVPGEARLTVVNDRDHPRVTTMAVSGDGKSIFVANTAGDEVWRFSRPGGAAERIPVGDGPTGLATWVDGAGQEWLLVAHEWAGELRLINTALTRETQVIIPVTGNVLEVLVDARRGWALLANHRLNALEVVDLKARKVLRTLKTGVRPHAMTPVDGQHVLVANDSTEDLSLVDLVSGDEQRLAPKPGMPILGGRTKDLSAFIMGGKRVRGLAYSPRLKVAFGSGMGPNLGPNPAREEVTMNGGVVVVDPTAGKVLRHVHMGGGLGDGVALDEARGLLFVASVSTGRVVVMDARALAGDDKTASAAVLGEVAILPPAGTPFIRDEGDLGVSGRPGLELHSGPRAVALADGGRTLLVLNRLTRTVSEVDVSQAARGKMSVRATLAPPVATAQRDRWVGEMVYYSDVGNTGMSCDACHPDGSTGGVLFTKGSPMQIYRSSNLRSIRDTPPYFTPQRTPSLQATSSFVLGRNRFHNPDPGKREVHALSIFTSLFVCPPSPYAGPAGELPERVTLPDGKVGSPRAGMGVFEGKGGCSTLECHPGGGPMSGDQALATRGRFHDVGSGQFLPIRQAMQDAREPTWPPAPLVGVWDVFPLFNSGSGGWGALEDGTLAAPSNFALRAVVEHPGASRHGKLGMLSAQEKDDLLAYLMTL